MKNQPALFYVETWLAATSGMEADARAWYLNLMLHHFTKGELPANMEDLASIAGVKFSEYTRFEHVFEHLLKHLFRKTETNVLVSNIDKPFIVHKEIFKEKRSAAGKTSYLSRYIRKKTNDQKLIKFVLKTVDLNKLDTKNEHMLEQVFKSASESYNKKGDQKPEPPKPPKKPKVPVEYWNVFIAQWDAWYLEKTANKYNYMPKDFAHLKKIYQFLEKRAEEKQFAFTEENLIKAFKFFLQKAWDKDDWLKRNFTIPNLLSQFNQIVNGTPKTSKQPTGAEVSTGSLFSRINTMPD